MARLSAFAAALLLAALAVSLLPAAHARPSPPANCPPGTVKCLNGFCAQNIYACQGLRARGLAPPVVPRVVAPDAHPTDAFAAALADTCTSAGWTLCPSSSICAPSADLCPRTCADLGWSTCQDGGCVPSADQCPENYRPPVDCAGFGLVFCADGTCAPNKAICSLLSKPGNLPEPTDAPVALPPALPAKAKRDGDPRIAKRAPPGVFNATQCQRIGGQWCPLVGGANDPVSYACFPRCPN